MDRAYIDDRGRWCVFPCQKRGKDSEKLPRECRVPVAGYAGKMWSFTGTAEAPTLSPSIDCADKPCWHGFIINGEVQL